MSDPKKHPKTDHGEREFDRTSLKQTTHGRYVSRDYAAHWFRWQHAKRFIKPGMRVLDVGCGEDQMMPAVLCQSQSFVPELYVGVDLNKLARKSQISWTRILDEFDVTRRWAELLDARQDPRSGRALGPFDLVCCFEVIEHMPVERGRALLKALRQLVKPTGTVLLSTPVYNGKHMAANHIHEYGFEELRAEILKAGFEVTNVVGTFMTSQAAKRAATPYQRALLEELHEKWYAWDVLANFLAPLYPAVSSNCCWLLQRKA